MILVRAPAEVAIAAMGVLVFSITVENAQIIICVHVSTDVKTQLMNKVCNREARIYYLSKPLCSTIQPAYQ